METHRVFREARKLRRDWQAGARPGPDLFRLADLNGVLVFKLTIAPDLSGLLVRSSSLKPSIIIVNTNRKNVFHQRFTLAHELGHLRLHGSEEEVFDDAIDESTDAGGTDRDSEANWFAAELLVPYQELQRVVRSFCVPDAGLSDRLVIELASYFGVSHQAMLWRLKALRKLSADEVKGRIAETNWDQAWRTYAPEEHSNTQIRHEPAVSWRQDGVSEDTARQISKLPDAYREMAFEAYRRRLITAAKLAEILGLPSKQVVIEELLPLIDPDQHRALRDAERSLELLPDEEGG